jgi:uncharacterized protein YaaN involved in tellurite resistance
MENLIKNKDEVLEIRKSIEELNYENIISYGADASKSIGDFSSSLLSNIKIKDMPDVEKLLTELMGNVKKVDPNTLLETKQSFLKKIFKVNEVDNFVMKYKTIKDVITEIERKLTESQYSLKQSIKTFEIYSDKNMEYIVALDNYIRIGKEKIENVKDEIADDEATIDKNDSLSIALLVDKKNNVDRFEKHVFNLMLLRENAIQNIPVLNMIKDGNAALIADIQMAIQNSIPLWERQITIVVKLMEQENALLIKKSVTDMNDQLSEVINSLLKNNMISIATELEKQMYDINNLKKSSDTLIETIQNVNKIREDGKNKRKLAEKQLEEIHVNLSKSLADLSKPL